MPDYKCIQDDTPLNPASVENYGNVLYCGKCFRAYSTNGKPIEIIGFSAFLEKDKLLVRNADLPVMRL